MELSDEYVRDRLLQIYADHRQAPEAPFDEDRFINHLLEPPAGRRQIGDSFAGTRRHVRFVYAVQAEFAVFFSNRDWETDFSLDQLVDRIRKLRSNPSGSMRSMKNARASYDVNVVIVLNVLVLSLAAISHGIRWLFAVLVVVWVVMNSWMVWFYRREKRYLDDLEVKILALSSQKKQAE